jgi:hypothetical protein
VVGAFDLALLELTQLSRFSRILFGGLVRLALVVGTFSRLPSIVALLRELARWGRVTPAWGRPGHGAVQARASVSAPSRRRS